MQTEKEIALQKRVSDLEQVIIDAIDLGFERWIMDRIRLLMPGRI